MNEFDRSLLERVEAASDTSSIRARELDKSVLLRSVLGNVRRVLNERHGSCETRADYGLPDLNDALGRGGSPAEFSLMVQRTIERFEPRLSDVVVRFVPDSDHPMRINYRIAAMLHFGEGSERVSFDTILSEDKRIHVRG